MPGGTDSHPNADEPTASRSLADPPTIDHPLALRFEVIHRLQKIGEREEASLVGLLDLRFMGVLW
jgi:hypothetical protein